MLAVPKKKKIIRIIIIILGRVESYFNANPPAENTASEQLSDALMNDKPILYSFSGNENEWTTEQETVMAIIDDLDTILEGSPSESDMAKKLNDFSEALEDL